MDYLRMRSAISDAKGVRPASSSLLPYGLYAMTRTRAAPSSGRERDVVDHAVSVAQVVSGLQDGRCVDRVQRDPLLAVAIRMVKGAKFQIARLK